MENEGRYLVSRDAMEKLIPPAIVFHDTDHLQEQCNTDQIERRQRFDDIDWALGRGYRRCLHCFGQPA